jgi:hypothetical protein
VTIKRSVLSDAISFLSKLHRRKSTIHPSYRFTGTSIQVTSGETTGEYLIDGEPVAPMTIPAHGVEAFLRGPGSDLVTITALSDKEAEIRCGTTRLKVSLFDQRDWSWPEYKWDEFFQCDGEILSKAVKQASIFAGSAMVHGGLDHLQMSSEGGLHLLSMDRRNFAVSVVEGKCNLAEPLFVPIEFVPILQGLEGEVSLLHNGRRFCINTSRGIASTVVHHERLAVVGEKMLGKLVSAPRLFTIDREVFLAALRGAASVPSADKLLMTALLSIKEGRLHVDRGVADNDYHADVELNVLNVDLVDTSLTVWLPALLPILEALDCQFVEVRMADTTVPMAVYPAVGQYPLFATMGMK